MDYIQDKMSEDHTHQITPQDLSKKGIIKISRRINLTKFQILWCCQSFEYEGMG